MVAIVTAKVWHLTNELGGILEEIIILISMGWLWGVCVCVCEFGLKCITKEHGVWLYTKKKFTPKILV